MLCSLNLHNSQHAKGDAPSGKKRVGLHWRKKPPQWGGSIEDGYCRAYPDLVQEVLCFQCGAIPCPYDHVEGAKTQKLTDLNFIKELASERGEIKQSIKKVNDEMEAMKKREGLLLIDKELLQNRIKVFEKLKSEWMHAETMMSEEIRRLTSLNEQKKDIIGKFQNERMKLKQSQQRLNAIEEENKILRGENEIYRKQLLNQTDESSNLTKQKDTLVSELERSSAKVKALLQEIKETKEELTSTRNSSNQLQVIIADMETMIQCLEGDIADKEQQYKDNEIEYNKLIQQLNTDVSTLKEENVEADNKIKKQSEVIDALSRLVARLKKRLADDSRFQQFVEVKRDYNVLKSISSTVVQKLQDYENGNPLPAMAETGNIRRTSLAYGKGSRPNTYLLDRPKLKSPEGTIAIKDSSDCHSESSTTSSGISST